MPFQTFMSVEDRRAHPAVYFLPYERLGKDALDDVLIVGAGTGTDVAVSLSEGAKHVDAVEIDPRILQIGEQLHPDRPYDDPRVTTIIDDARAFLERTDKKYDLILFALPDSLTLVSGQSSLRLESYLFTQEAMERARSHLKPDGAFAMYNYYWESWLVDRQAGTLAAAYGHAPCVDSIGTVSHLAVISVRMQGAVANCPAAWVPGDAAAAASPRPMTTRSST